MAWILYTTFRYDKKTTSLVKHSLKNNLSSKSLQNHVLVQCCDFLWFRLWGFGKNRFNTALVCYKEANSQETMYFEVWEHVHNIKQFKMSHSGLTFSPGVKTVVALLLL